MITIQKHYSSLEEALSNIGAGRNGERYSIWFCSDSLNLEIEIDGTQNFKEFLQNIHDAGMSMVDSND